MDALDFSSGFSSRELRGIEVFVSEDHSKFLEQ
jgi:hypothetical protein